jgi:hypothetical protein
LEVEAGVGLERVAKSTADLSGPVRQVGARMLDAHCVKVGDGAATRNLKVTTVAMYFWSAGC